MWHHAMDRWPGEPVRVVHGVARRIVERPGGTWRIEIDGLASEALDADRVVVAAGGLATPVLLGRSLGLEGGSTGGYHDHPMAYVAKLRLRPDSALARISCVDEAGLSLRTGFTYTDGGIKAAVYLRPALGLGLRSITGDARFVLSDLRNQPFSPRKWWQLLTNPEAIREGLLFKSGAGFRGRDYSLLLLGEQEPRPDRGLTIPAQGHPELQWRVTAEEFSAYQAALAAFLGDFAGEIAEVRTVPLEAWGLRTAAHHSGGISQFLASVGDPFSIRDMPGVSACDGSVLRASGVANSGLTLTALALMLAEELAGA
jgi:hypothetical protein